MNLHQTNTQFNAGIDLHTTNLWVCVRDLAGETHLHRKVRDNDLNFLAKLLTPFKDDLTVCCESTCNWYFLHDFCVKLGVEFVLGHALYIRAIAQNKIKNDKIDSQVLADLLRTNFLPVGYVMPAELRGLRELMRRRMYLVNKRTGMKSSLTMSVHMQGFTEFTKKEKLTNQQMAAFRSRSSSEVLLTGWQSFVEVIDTLDREIRLLEKAISKYAGEIGHSDELAIIQSFPGIGEVLSSTILFEIGTIGRFPSVQDFSSYSRLVVPDGESNGKKCGKRSGKIGNPNLNWAINEAAVLMPGNCTAVKRYYESLQKKKGKRAARHTLAHRIGRAIYFCLKRQTAFDLPEFLKGKESFLDK